MPIILSDLYENIKKYEVKLVAGEKGLGNRIHWMHIVENKEITEFLEGDEVVFTTGVAIKDDKYFYEFIKSNKEKNISGIIINIGPYINSISKEIIDYCDENDLALFTVPWHVKMPQIMKTLSKMIIQSEEDEIEENKALLNILLYEKSKDIFKKTLENMGFSQEDDYKVVVIDINKENATENIERKISTIKEIIEKKIRFKCMNGIVTLNNHSIITLFKNHHKIEIESFIKEIIKLIRKQFYPMKIYYGIGNKVHGLDNINKSYKYAKSMAGISVLLRSSEYNILFDDLPIYRLFLAIEDKKILKEYYNEILGDLYEYDKVNKTDYIYVLKNYINNNCNVSQTSGELFVHRNTINYKINKIEEILDCKLSDIGTKSRIYMALMIEHIIL